MSKKNTQSTLRILAGMVAGLLAIGTVFYHVVEGFSWIDSFYFTVITLSTVGYGHMFPATNIGKLFTVAYIIIGVGTLGAFISEYTSYRLSKKK